MSRKVEQNGLLLSFLLGLERLIDGGTDGVRRFWSWHNALGLGKGVAALKVSSCLISTASIWWSFSNSHCGAGSMIAQTSCMNGSWL